MDKYSHANFFDYAPKVFQVIRRYNHITNEEYLKSLGPESLSGLLSGAYFKGKKTAGKSGSFFFTTSDSKYFVKTVPDREFDIAV